MTWTPTKGTTARGYGHKHQQLRKQWAMLVKAGDVRCWRCGLPIYPTQQWHLGHDDWNRGIYRGPEHKHCNMVGAARNSTRKRLSKRGRRLTDADRWLPGTQHGPAVQ